MDVRYSIGKLLRKFSARNRFDGNFLFSVLCAFLGLFAKNHIGIIDKVLVYRVAVFGLTEMNPIGFDFDGSVTLLQKQNVGNDTRTGIGKKGIVGQSDCTK